MILTFIQPSLRHAVPSDKCSAVVLRV